jgi:phospholipid transport system substrate-binding protein
MKQYQYLFFTCFFALISNYAFGHEDPSALVANASEQVRSVLAKEDGNNTAEIRKQAEDILYPRFDFLRMTALAVGRPWRSATPEQKDKLIEQFRTLLTGTYFNTMLRYRDAKIIVDPKIIIENNGKEATVRSSVIVKDVKDPVSIDYVLYKTEEGWKVFNVNVEGASLVTVYRNQFGEEVSKGGIDQLISTLKNKNEKIQS